MTQVARVLYLCDDLIADAINSGAVTSVQPALGLLTATSCPVWGCMQTYNGAVACQMLDRLHPGVLPLKKVDFNANQAYLYEQNWRLLQQAFRTLGIKYVSFHHSYLPIPSSVREV